MEKIQFQSLSFCHGRQYLDASVIFPGVGHIWPNFLPAHNDVALVRNYQPISKPVCSCNSAQPLASVWSTALEFLVVADCLMGGGQSYPWEQNLIFMMIFLALIVLLVGGQKPKREHIRSSLQYPILLVLYEMDSDPQICTNTHIVLDVRVWPGLRSQGDMAD